MLVRERDKARAAFAKSPERDASSSAFKRAKQAAEALAENSDKLDDLREAQAFLLREAGAAQSARRDQNANGPRSGDFAAGDPWHALAEGIDLPSGRNRVDVPLGDLLHSPAMAGMTVTPSSGLKVPTQFREEITEMARDERHLFDVFPTELVEDTALGISDYRQTGERVVSGGSVERDPISTAAKAQLSLEVTAESLALRQVAVVLEKVPSKLIEALDTFQAFLQNELAFQLRLALDAHVAAALAASGPAKGEAGSDLISKIRKAVEAARAAGAKPSVLAVSPAVASELDLTKRNWATSSPFATSVAARLCSGCRWSKCPVSAKPTLIDPNTAGVLYLGMARLFVDQWSGLAKNEVRLRLEAETLMWVRDAHGLYVIDKAE